jgi:integral membrane protein (TIGR00529 family)
MRLGPLQLGKSAVFSLTRLQTVSLILIVAFILIISRLMKESGQLERIVSCFGRLSRDDRTSGSVMPALIGLLPMPGGALFSAPMVETALSSHPMTGEEKTAVNYWFRHIWEYWWPLYPGVVLAVALLEVDTWRFMTFMAPMTLVTVLAGVVFILIPLGSVHAHQRESVAWSDIKEFLWEIMPILIVVLVIMALAGLTSIIGLFGLPLKIPGAISILPGLMASTMWVCFVNRISLKQFGAAVLDKDILPMLFLIAAIMIFKGIMTDSQAVLQIRDELMAWKIPIILIVLIMPFLSGIITGIAIGFVGTSFPLIVPLFPSSHIFDYLSYAALAYTFGYMGMMLSPVHLCLLVTKDYFKANLLSSYRYLLIPAFTVMMAAVVIFLVSRLFS